MNSSSPAGSRDEYDFVCLGGGSAGYAAARTAAALGLRVAVVEGGREVGGLCILRGCMPSKTVIESANRFITMRRANEFGLRAENLAVVQPEILARKRRLVGEFAEYRRGQLEKGGFDFLRGHARFTGEHSLEITGLGGDSGATREIRARTILIATGSKAACPPLPGLDKISHLTSDEALELDRLPKSIVILGAGAIGLEAAHQFNGLGVETTVVQRGGHVLRDADTDAAGALEEGLASRGVRFYCGSRVVRIEQDETGLGKRVWFERAGESESVGAEEIFCALGRLPNTDGLDLEKAGVELTPKGAIEAGADQRSTCPHIFAAGDVCGPYEIVHIAIQQAEVAARNAARLLGKAPGPAEEIDYRLRLFALFCEPQFGSVGLTEREAAEQGLAVRTACYRFADHGKAMVRGETDGFVKLIVADHGVEGHAPGEILGGCVVGIEASELIHEIVVAMNFRATARQLAAIPHYHPTLSEIWTYPAEELAEPS